MNVALDTNAYRDFLRGDPIRVDIVRRADRIFLPLRQQGSAIPTNDLGIAALAVQHGSGNDFLQNAIGLQRRAFLQGMPGIPFIN